MIFIGGDAESRPNIQHQIFLNIHIYYTAKNDVRNKQKREKRYLRPNLKIKTNEHLKYTTM